MSELLTWAPSQPTPIKVILSVIIFALFIGAQAVIWISPAPKKEAEKATAVAPAAPSTSPHKGDGTGPSAAVKDHNSGIVAGVYNAAPATGQAQEDLAREQLAEIKRRRIEEQAAQRQRDLDEAQGRIRRRVDQLTQEYILSHDGLSTTLFSWT